MGPWFEGFIFIKDCTRKFGMKNIETTMKRANCALLHCLLVRRVTLLAMASWRRVKPWFWLVLLAVASSDSPEPVKMIFLTQKPQNQVSPSILRL
jgi:hypothetical protein